MFAMSDIKEKDKEETENTKVIAVACLTIYLFGVFCFFLLFDTLSVKWRAIT